MFNFFKKSKSKDNNCSTRGNNKNKKGKQQTVASNYHTDSSGKSGTQLTKSKEETKNKQERETSNGERDEVCESLNLEKITGEKVMGNTESKSESSSPGLNTIGGNEQAESNTARTEFLHLDKNANGIVGKADSLTSNSTSSPTVSDLLRGTGSWESASSNERKKKESTPDSDIVFKTAPNTPVLSRDDNRPRQLTLPAELPSIFEDTKLPQMEKNLQECDNIQEETDQKIIGDSDIMGRKVPDSDQEDMKPDANPSNHVKPVLLNINNTGSDSKFKESDIKPIVDGERSSSDLMNFKVEPSVTVNGEKATGDLESYSDCMKNEKCSPIDNEQNVVNSKENSDEKIVPDIDSAATSTPDVRSICEISEQSCEKECEDVVIETRNSAFFKNNDDFDPNSTLISGEVKFNPPQDSKRVIVDEYTRNINSCSSATDTESRETEDDKDSETCHGRKKFDTALELSSSSNPTNRSTNHSIKFGSKLDIGSRLPNCDELLVKLSTDFPDNSSSQSEDESVVCEKSEPATNDESSVENVADARGLNSGHDSMGNSCFSNDFEVSVCISMGRNDGAKVEEEVSTEVSDCESIQSAGLTESVFSGGNRTSEAEKEHSESAAGKIREVENLCPVAENNNGCLVDGSCSESTKADLQPAGIENLPKIIIESVEEQENGFVRHEENETEENCGEIYGDEESSDDDDDSEEPLTVMERSDFLVDKEKPLDGEQQGESSACVRDTAAQVQAVMLDRTKEHLVNAEKRAEKQMADLKSELDDSEKEMFRMRVQVQDLQRESIAKTGGMERLQAELSAAYKDSEFVRRKLKRLEEELASFKQKNSDLTEELRQKAEIENENDYWKVMELENEGKELTRRVKELEALLSATRAERDELKKKVDELLAESEEERKVAQEALDEAMVEKLAMQEKYEREFEKLRSANIDREQKMLDDFEWKLREVEQACKKRLDDKEQTSKQLVREVEGKLTVAEGKLAQLPHLKQCEQELNHLRERSIEQQRTLRTATRQLEQLQDSDKQQHEEIQQLKQLLEKEKSHLTTVQSIHYRELAEKDRKHQFKLDQQKTEINTEWEDKMRRETQRIKTESDRNHRTEKLQALDEAKSQHQHKLRELETSWEKKHTACVKEIDSLKTKLSEKEDYYIQEFETIQTKADRDIFELRRKLDKIDLSYQEQIEKIQQKHEKELVEVREDADRRIQQCELNAQHQIGASRTTIELVKEQMHRESQEKLQQLSEHHRRQLEEQWEQLVQERDDAIAMIEQKHRTSMEKLRNELDSIYKGRDSRETEELCLQNSFANAEINDSIWNSLWSRLLDTLNNMRQELSGKTTHIGSLESNVEELQENLEVLNCEVNNKAQQITKVMKEGEETTGATATGDVPVAVGRDASETSKGNRRLAKQRRRTAEDNCIIS
ncbi:myosin-11 isoform X4 [Nilaparvata lugens]|uniref:myosin-11 isoform X4 n=1 Tax=Nilaparvata lugens TaxID=108931 RepID=UPI00193D3A7F|nr:myosin-11 isoform X4 [Nilaparvata lugens]